MSTYNSEKLRLNIIRILCRHEGTASKSMIMHELKRLGVSTFPQHLHYHLSALVERGLVEKLDRGIYGLARGIIYCLPFLDNPIFSLISGLGERRGREKTVVEVAMEKLRLSGVNVSRSIVFVTNESRESWGQHLEKLNEILGINVEFILLEKPTIYNLDDMERRIENAVFSLMKNTIPIIDCTSLTKIYTISAYSVALKFMLPLIYIYEQEQRLVWIRDLERSKKDILSALKRELK